MRLNSPKSRVLRSLHAGNATMVEAGNAQLGVVMGDVYVFLNTPFLGQDGSVTPS